MVRKNSKVNINKIIDGFKRVALKHKPSIYEVSKEDYMLFLLNNKIRDKFERGVL